MRLTKPLLVGLMIYYMKAEKKPDKFIWHAFTIHLQNVKRLNVERLNIKRENVEMLKVGRLNVETSQRRMLRHLKSNTTQHKTTAGQNWPT